MNDRADVDLVARLADRGDVAGVPLTQVPAALAWIASEQARLAAIESALAARLAGAATSPPPTAADVTANAFLTQEEAASRYRIPLRSVRRLTRTERIPSTLIGRNRMIRVHDLETYLTRCQTRGVAVGAMLDV